MRQKLTSIIILPFFLFWGAGSVLSFNTTYTIEPPEKPVRTPVLDEETQVIQEIVDVSQEYGVNTDLALDLAYFESRYNPKAKNQEGSSASGIFQFISGTWENYCEGDVFNYKANIKCAMEFLSEPNGIRHWTADKRVERYLKSKGHIK